ncbi:hypothetical protein DFH28DRAFT_879601, partial [Melampsora americana]
KVLSPSSLRERERVHSYHRQSQLDQAHRNYKKYMQNKRRNEFQPLREALYLVSTYAGPFLQNPGDKKKAAHFLRSQSLGGMFVNLFDNDGRWQWLQSRISQPVSSL